MARETIENADKFADRLYECYEYCCDEHGGSWNATAAAALIRARDAMIERRALERAIQALNRVIETEWNEQRKLGAADARSAVYGMLGAINALAQGEAGE